MIRSLSKLLIPFFSSFLEQWNASLNFPKFTNEKRYLDEHGDSCKHIFLAEATKLGIAAETCNPASQGMDADYVVIYLAGERFYIDGVSHPLFTLEGGGDESKKHWFAAISNQNELDFMLPDGMTPTNQFMNSTLGKLIPFTIVTYVDLTTDMIHDNYRPGYIPIYAKELKFSDTENDPFYLVYASPSFYSDIPGQKNMILIYKINQNYQTQYF